MCFGPIFDFNKSRHLSMQIDAVRFINGGSRPKHDWMGFYVAVPTGWQQASLFVVHKGGDVLLLSSHLISP